MFLREGVVIYSASDFSAASECEFALMRRLDAILGRIDRIAEPDDPMLARAAVLGDAHEARALREFRARGRVVEIDRPNARTPGEVEESARQTYEELLSGSADVIFQGTFFDGRFLGFADFIMQIPGGTPGTWEVYDTKLARHARIKALLQLAAYSEQLHSLGIPIGPQVHLLLGDGSTSTHNLRDILPVFRRRRQRLEQMIDDRQADPGIVAWGDDAYSACGRCPTCTVEVESRRDVLMVAGMRPTQRAHLHQAGIVTIDDLAAFTGTVAGMPDEVLATSRAQARLQVDGHDGQAGRPLAYEVFAPLTLSALPEPSPGDIFFDFEGDPLYREGDVGAWGLDYLFGVIEHDQDRAGETRFVSFWAHSHAEEKQALLDFLAYVRQKRTEFPDLHIYHYAAYERTHLQQLTARYGVGEAELDDLLRERVLVDLYPIVKKSIRVGNRSYSLKKLEPLYMGEHLRGDGVTTADDSITAYVESQRLRQNGDEQASAAILSDIAVYNEYDCLSTLRLRDWLRERAREHHIPARPLGADLEAVVREPDPVYLALAAIVEAKAHARPAETPRSDDDTALALAAAAIDYHRREHKTFWWDHFNRLSLPVRDWEDTRNVLVVDPAVAAGRVAESVGDWGRTGRQRVDRRTLHLTGRLAPGSTLKIGDTPFLVYESAVPELGEALPGERLAHDRTQLVDIIESDGDTVFVIEEALAREGEPYEVLPMAVTPGKPPNPGTQVTAISEWGGAVLAAQPALPLDASTDILRRLPPRLKPGHATLAPVGAGDDAFVAAIRDSLLRLDDSYLAVQGPPGTGKTHVGAHAIAELVTAHGWKVGVVAQSHAAVENMLAGIVKAGLDPAMVGKKKRTGEASGTPAWTELAPGEIGAFVRERSTTGFVLGGTAWDFSNTTRVDRGYLDVLVVDEAGQFSLAGTIAAAAGARNLLLLGDPQQLPQVSQGMHPEPIDESALGWLSEGHEVLPESMGYFLASSWRMHPAVCAPVSALSYEGRLHSHPTEPSRRLLQGIEPGVHATPVTHFTNKTTSPEEAERVVALVRDLIGRPWTDPSAHRVADPLRAGDIIVVAPYNAQVAVLRQALIEAGFPGVEVGTVDKFQGQEAAVAIVSMAASSAADVPRGIEFLLLPNRLNVAISRAKWAAYLVYSPELTEYLPRNTVALAHLSGFITLVDGAILQGE